MDDVNQHKIYVTLGASNHCKDDRADLDFYNTNPEAVKVLLNKLKEDNIELHQTIWEPACGNGLISKVLEEYGYNVISSDIVEREYSNMIIRDFLTYNEPMNTQVDILTNPPYKYAQQFVEKALSLQDDGYYTIMYLRIQFLEGKARYKLFQEYPPKYVYVNSTRRGCSKDNNFSGGAVCFCWFIWEKGFTGEPIIRWLK